MSKFWALVALLLKIIGLIERAEKNAQEREIEDLARKSRERDVAADLLKKAKSKDEFKKASDRLLDNRSE